MKKIILLFSLMSLNVMALSESKTKAATKSICLSKGHFANKDKIDDLLNGRKSSEKKGSPKSSGL